MAVGHEETEYVRAVWTWLHYLGEPKVLESSSYISLASQIPGTVITNSKGLYDALAKSQSSGLGLKDDRRSAIECLALRQCMSQTGCLIRWVHSEAMVVDSMTKWSSQVARDTTMSFAKQWTWRVVQDNKFTAAKIANSLGASQTWMRMTAWTEQQYSSHLTLKKMMLKILQATLTSWNDLLPE